MPIRPPPLEFTCPQCGWKTVTHPASDALLPHEYPLACPKCGGEELDVKQASGIKGGLLSAIKTFLSTP